MAGATKILSEEVFRGLVETTLSRVVFRNMASEDRSGEEQTGEEQTGEEQTGEYRADDDPAGQNQDQPRPRDDRLQLELTDPKAMRALAHPLRWALLEALSHAGTLTATQASEMLGESPANCAFHLRTLAKYGFVEEAGGGKGRERPWRQAFGRMSWQARRGDEQFRLAGQALNQVWLDRVLSRARRSLAATASWPEGFGDDLGGSTSMLYVTPDEARELYAELMKTVERTIGQDHRFTERRDPAHRPPGAVPVEFVLLGYPVLDAPPLPGGSGDSSDDGGDNDSESGDPDASPGGADSPIRTRGNVGVPRHSDGAG
jgi:predicted transcriptional regulator